MPATLTLAPFCSWTDVTNRLGAAGAALRVDDNPAVQSWVLGKATVKVLGYLWSIYHDNGLPSVNALANSNQVRELTADVALYFLNLRRNNAVPKSAMDLYKEAIDDLKQLQKGQMLLWDCPQNKANIPVLSNQRVSLWPFARIVVVDGKSTGDPQGYIEFGDSSDDFDYSQ